MKWLCWDKLLNLSSNLSFLSHFLQLVLQTRGSQQSGLFHISYPAAPPKAAGEKLIWKFNPNEPGCLHAAKGCAALGLKPQTHACPVLGLWASGWCGCREYLSMSLAAAGTEDHLIYGQHKADKQAGCNVRHNLQIPLDTDHVLREASKSRSPLI